eukprot:scaffold80783_cov35-Tisochrysis_lutea.AAC.1
MAGVRHQANEERRREMTTTYTCLLDRLLHNRVEEFVARTSVLRARFRFGQGRARCGTVRPPFQAFGKAGTSEAGTLRLRVARRAIVQTAMRRHSCRPPEEYRVVIRRNEHRFAAQRIGQIRVCMSMVPAPIRDQLR